MPIPTAGTRPLTRHVRAGLLVAIVAALAACGGGDGPSEPVATLTAGADTTRVGGMLTLTVRGASAEGAFSATVGGVPAGAIATDDSTVVLVVPVVSVGTHDVTLSRDGESVTARVRVQAALEIADPAAALRASVSAWAAGAPATQPAGMSASAWTTYRRRTDSLAADIEARVASATPAQRLQVARLLVSAGLDAPDAPMAPPTGTRQRRGSVMLAADVAPRAAIALPGQLAYELNGACAAASAHALAKSIIFVVALAGVGAAVVLPADPITKSLAAAAAFYVAWHMHPEASAAWVTVGETCGAQQSVTLADDLLLDGGFGADTRLRIAAAVLTTPLRDSITVTKYPAGLFRPIDGSDVAREPQLAEGATVVDYMYAIVRRLPSWVQAQLPPLPPQLSNRAPGATQMRRVSPSAVRLENVAPATVRLVYQASGDALLLTASFREGATRQDTPFSFDIVSTTDATLRTRIDATLAPKHGGRTARYRGTWVGGGINNDGSCQFYNQGSGTVEAVFDTVPAPGQPRNVTFTLTGTNQRTIMHNGPCPSDSQPVSLTFTTVATGEQWNFTYGAPGFMNWPTANLSGGVTLRRLGEPYTMSGGITFSPGYGGEQPRADFSAPPAP